jgi:hypothetical protein
MYVLITWENTKFGKKIVDIRKIKVNKAVNVNISWLKWKNGINCGIEKFFILG